MTAEPDLLPCGQCGMPCRADEYHPFATCLMFKACHNSETVRANLAPLQAEIEALRAEVVQLISMRADAIYECTLANIRADKLTEALREAREMVEDWAGYAGEYFQNKHDLQGDLAKLDAVLREQEEGHEQ